MSFRSTESDSIRETRSVGVRIAIAGIEYDPETDEYTVIDAPGNAGFEQQGAGDYLLKANPTTTTASVRAVGEIYMVTT